jgi:circadian clock protein KaiC
MGDLALAKSPTGIPGLDEVTEGGLPQGRPTLVCGTAGCGKTILGLQFLVRGALDFDEPGVFVSFEETAEELSQNVSSVGWDLPAMARDGRLIVDHVRIEAAEIEEAGAYDLEGLFIRLGAAIDEIGAKRVVIDTLEVLFGALRDHATLRSELRRLFRWLKDRGVTAVVTAERGDGSLTRHGMEEYVSDCVILLDHRVDEQLSTRRLRVVKYRGSRHGTDETPFMIDEHGFRVMPLSSLRLAHDAPLERVSTGVARLDTMLTGDGYYRGGSMLVTGSPGSGKTTLAASFVRAGCERGERSLLFAFEESPEQLIRNQRSVGIDLRPHIDTGLLCVRSTRPAAHGLEGHLASIIHDLDVFDPQLVVIDPLSAFGSTATDREAMLTRLIDLLKARGITALCTSMTTSDADVSELGISSVIDVWMDLQSVEVNGERNRSLTIIKARGTAHSNQVREFVMSSDGIELVDVYTGGADVVMGSARKARDSADLAAAATRAATLGAKRRRIELRRAAVEAEIANLRGDLEAETELLEAEIRVDEAAEQRRSSDSVALATSRHADAEPPV